MLALERDILNSGFFSRILIICENQSFVSTWIRLDKDQTWLRQITLYKLHNEFVISDFYEVNIFFCLHLQVKSQFVPTVRGVLCSKIAGVFYLVNLL